MSKEEIIENIVWSIIIGLLIGLFAWLGIVKATCVLFSLWLVGKIIE